MARQQILDISANSYPGDGVTTSLDLSIDWLADAPLTPEQRLAWSTMRTELVDTRARILDLEKRIKLIEQQPPEEMHTILTRPEFNREVARMLAFDERYGGISSVLYFDFENLEQITSRHGKAVANAAIREISNVLIKCVRGSDIVGRLATDEFGVLLTRCNNEDAWKKGKDLSAALCETLVEVHGCKLELEISYGAYTFRDDEDVSTGLKEAAQMVTKAETRQ